MTWTRLLALPLALAAFTGCSDNKLPIASPAPTSENPSATPTEAVSETPTPTTTAASPTGSATPVANTLGNGRHYGYLAAIDADGRLVTTDIVQFLTGEAAEKAAAEDGEEVTNDYYIKNENSLLRTISIRGGAAITTNTLSAEETGDSTKDLSVTLEKLAGYFETDSEQAKSALFILTIRDGVMTELHEQYLP